MAGRLPGQPGDLPLDLGLDVELGLLSAAAAPVAPSSS
jgi:hypothetical protein